MTEILIEPFAAARQVLHRGIPSLSASKHRKTMCVEWHDDCSWDFRSCVDADGMNADLLEVWKRYKPQCDRRASFSRGRTGGYMAYVPIEAGLEAMGIVREYYTRALEIMIIEQIARQKFDAHLEKENQEQFEDRLCSE
jgi:hypothetical protein